jgi:outer membrane immunogenic protein
MRKAILATVGATILISAPAMSQEAVGGPYVGVIVGLDSVGLDVDTVGSGSDEGVMYGVVAGFDAPIARSFLLGLEGEANQSETGEGVNDVLVAGDRAELNAGRDLYLGARLVGTLSGYGKVFVKAGYTNAKVSLSYDDGTTVTGESATLDGYRIGGGFEFGLTETVSVRTEYRYSDYGQFSYQGLATGVSADRHQGVVGLIASF